MSYYNSAPVGWMVYEQEIFAGFGINALFMTAVLAI